jgi:hypothetical protein
METESYPRAVRVEGEVVVLHCWACGTAHCVNFELCAPERLPYMACSNDRCKMSMFLINELEIHNDTLKEKTKSELGALLGAYSRFWK